MPDLDSTPLPIGQCATVACLLEVSASKPGNVHRGADFENLKFEDFLLSAVAIGPAMEATERTGVGAAVLAAIRATRRFVTTNTNLGMMLLMAPLAAVPRDQKLATGIRTVLDRLDAADSAAVYEAIRLAQPGSLGRVHEMDVAEAAPPDLIAAMRAAAQRDLVARQYTNHFREVLDEGLPWLLEGLAAGWPMPDAIVHLHLRLMQAHPDSLIARKCGLHVAEHAGWQAGEVLNSGQPGDDDYYQALGDFDFWLRSDGHRRNPGTTADLVAAALFAGLREGMIDAAVR